MIKRKITSKLCEFYDNSRKALLLTGARQTGKSFSVRHFGQSHYRHFIEINFIEQPTARNIFRKAIDVQDMLMRLTVFASDELVAGETLEFPVPIV